MHRLSLIVAASIVGCSCGGAAPVATTRAPVRGVAMVGEPSIGEIGHASAVLWARCAQAGTRLYVRVDDARVQVSASGASEGLGAVRVRLEGLGAGAHAWAAWCSESADADEVAPGDAARGTLMLAPEESVAAGVRFAWGGDVGGQDVCRRVEGGFPTLADAARDERDFFVALGDMIYADSECTSEARFGGAQHPAEIALDLAGYRARWRYSLEDAGYQALRRRVYAVWDDHEIVNDAGPLSDTRSGTEHLLPLARAAYLEANPFAMEPDDATSPLYRAQRWGQHMDLVLLDTRSHRDANLARDDGAEPKTLLGAAQRAWLEERFAESDATWMVIASSVPLSLPTGWPPENGRDGWADLEGAGTGFERELVGILRAAQRMGRRNLVFITTDVHFSAAFRYVPFEDDPSFVVHELVSGPLAAHIYPIPVFDPTLRGERLLYHAPVSSESVRTMEEARPFLTWGEIEVARSGGLTARIRNVDDVVYELALTP